VRPSRSGPGARFDELRAGSFKASKSYVNHQLSRSGFWRNAASRGGRQVHGRGCASQHPFALLDWAHVPTSWLGVSLRCDRLSAGDRSRLRDQSLHGRSARVRRPRVERVRTGRLSTRFELLSPPWLALHEPAGYRPATVRRGALRVDRRGLSRPLWDGHQSREVRGRRIALVGGRPLELRSDHRSRSMRVESGILRVGRVHWHAAFVQLVLRDRVSSPGELRSRSEPVIEIISWCLRVLATQGE
jgi:hypothetical protein